MVLACPLVVATGCTFVESAGAGGGSAVDGGDGGLAGNAGSAPRYDGPVTLTVTTNNGVHAISPLIYGVNSGRVSCSDSTARFTLCRAGGNPWSTYNWENNASNAGSDHCFENNGGLGTSNAPAATVTALVTETRTNAQSAVVMVPIIDYVAADKNAGTPDPLCSGDVRAQTGYLATRFQQNRARKGSAFAASPDTADDFVSQDEFLDFLKPLAGTGKVIFTLDNQPELWSQTHAEVHPDHATYQEVVARNVEYAQMIRDNWPEAQITGYGGYGYYAFLNLQNAPNPPGNSEFLNYYLASMQLAETQATVRLIDYLDIHWYSEATAGGVRIDVNASPPALVEARVQAPRSLWDPTYTEESWIGSSVGAIRLIPWLQEKITAYYPGTKIAISEWSYGGENDISGALAVADALGIYGREGVGLAGFQPISDDNAFARGGFAVFRNYDGAGTAFGDTSVEASSDHVENVSVYASTDSLAPGRVVIVAINRTTSDVVSTLDLVDSGSFSSADVYVLTTAATTPTQTDSLVADGANTFRSTLPPLSATVIVPKP
jgi:hypothetical protein